MSICSKNYLCQVVCVRRKRNLHLTFVILIIEDSRENALHAIFVIKNTHGLKFIRIITKGLFHPDQAKPCSSPLFYFSKRFLHPRVARVNRLSRLVCAMCSERLEGHGYVVAQVTSENPLFPVGLTVRGHDFHHSSLLKLDDLQFAYQT